MFRAIENGACIFAGVRAGSRQLLGTATIFVALTPPALTSGVAS
jgi:uncharacterized membrane protein